MYQMLREHPQLFVPDEIKETMFFDRRYERGMSWYAQYFDKSRTGQLCGEVAPTYFDVPEVPERVYEVSPEASIIVSLRHPVERAFSLYLHHLRKGRVSGDFRDAISQKPRILTAGHYARHVARWKSVFGEKQIHFLFLDDIKNRPQFVLGQMCSWLGVNAIDQFSGSNKKVNAASMPRFPLLAKAAAAFTTWLHEHGLHLIVDIGKRMGIKKLVYEGREDKMPELTQSDRTELLTEYEEDIAFMEGMTGRNLSHWRK
jgi:hypothetical protein